MDRKTHGDEVTQGRPPAGSQPVPVDGPTHPTTPKRHCIATEMPA